ncbi:DUF397 domain-containing protein [Streptomyces sp. NPDC001941]|uniref:DUF397 domain-containing protein n=1 Tax=Streptomyces sp. NPDC001941 TaxID=3154659 RepID=UPI00331FE0E0
MSNTLRWFKSSYSDSGGGNCVEIAYDWRKSSYSSSSGGECIEVSAPWRKSTHSDSGGGECVEVAPCPHSIHVRDSKLPRSPVFSVTPRAWSAFVAWQG